MSGFASAAGITVDESALDYVERAFGAERAQRWIEEGEPLVQYRVAFKKRGNPDTFGAAVHAERGALGWWKTVQEDAPGARLDLPAARERVRAALTAGLGLDLSRWEERSASTDERPARRDHTFVFERTLAERPELRERAVATVAGEEVASAYRALVVPGPARREARALEAPFEALSIVGWALACLAAAAAFVAFLRKLQDGEVRLGRVGAAVTVLWCAWFATQVLETPRLFAIWDPLWPRWIAVSRTLLEMATWQSWLLIVLLAVIAAGDAIDRDAGARRGESLWRLGSGAWLDRSVAAASGRGFLVGLVCGGVLSVAVRALSVLAGGRIALEPRGFFLDAMNAASPSVWTLVFFLNTALTEELAYRFFGVAWILGITRRRWLAIVAPAVVFGLTHTTASFLPPAEPFWGRALVMTLVGCLWGWAFLRYDALTVVFSHYCADLFIFSWPRLASGQLFTTAAALVTVSLPLLPAVSWGIRRLTTGRGKAESDPPSR